MHALITHKKKSIPLNNKNLVWLLDAQQLDVHGGVVQAGVSAHLSSLPLALTGHTWQARDKELEDEVIFPLIVHQNVQLVHQGVLLTSQLAPGQLYNYECSLQA